MSAAIRKCQNWQHTVSPVAWQHINFYGRYEFTTSLQSIDLDAVVRELADRPIIAVEEGEE